jgi:hypothetical protein
MTTKALRFILISTLSAGLLFIATAFSAEPEPSRVVLNIAQGWQVSFDAQSSVLECRHAPSGTRLAGPLVFTQTLNGKPTQWKVEPARDKTPHRLALVDGRNDTQGYVAIRGDLARLTLTVVHRPPHTYPGKLCFTPAIEFGSGAFACRTHFAESPVVQMASGPADSLLNDSLFDPQRDMLLRLDGQDRAISTQAKTEGVGFQARLTAEVSKADAATITVELIPDYYRSSYVPYYRLIDRKRCPKAPTGWMAWNIYFDPATEEDNLAEARVAAKYLKQFGLEFWSIESWQENSPRLPVSKFSNLTMKASAEEFPHGMKWLADEIRKLGFRPGIWTVSFGTGDEKFYQEHRDWFLHDREGRPMKNWNGLYVLDPSQAAVRKFTEDTHRTMSKEWGYEFFKSDGMSGRSSGYSAHFFERPEVRAAFREPCEDPYGLWIESLRRGIGPDRVFLACQGHYSGPDVAYCDAARNGGDIVHFPNTPDWACYLRQANATQSQLFVNNILWYNDPDTLLVGEFAPLDVARLATTVVALPGQLNFFGDKLGKLPPDRMRLLQQTLPVCDVRPLDLAPLDELKPIWDLKIRRPFADWDVVSLFNWSDKPATLRATFAQLGLDSSKEYLVYEFWSRKLLGSHREQVEVALAPHSNALVAVHAKLDRPQYLSTDRHVSQGGVELTDVNWNQGRAELACTFKLVENDRLTAMFHTPPQYVLGEATAEGASVEGTSVEASPLVVVTLRRDTSGESRLHLRFRRTKANAGR